MPLFFNLEFSKCSYSQALAPVCGALVCNIITIVIIHAVNHSYNLSFFSINIKMFSLFLHIMCSKRGGGRHLFSSRKQILVGMLTYITFQSITIWLCSKYTQNVNIIL